MSDTLLEMMAKAYAEPDPLPYLFRVGQRVRVLNKVVQDGQTHPHWAGAIATVTSRYTTGLHKDHIYKLRIEGRGPSASAEFKENEIDRRYAMPVKPACKVDSTTHESDPTRSAPTDSGGTENPTTPPNATGTKGGCFGNIESTPENPPDPRVTGGRDLGRDSAATAGGADSTSACKPASPTPARPADGQKAGVAK